MIRCSCELAPMQGARATSNELLKSTTPIVAGVIGGGRLIQLDQPPKTRVERLLAMLFQKANKETMHRKQEQLVDVTASWSQRPPPPFSFPLRVRLCRSVSSRRHARQAPSYSCLMESSRATLSPIFRRSNRSFSTSFLPRWKAKRLVVSSLLAGSRFVASRPEFDFAGASGRA